MRRIETKVEKWMLCYLCEDLIEKITVLSCEHYFCESCIVSWIIEEEKCPECEKSVNVGEFSGANLFMKRLGFLNFRLYV